MTVSHAKQMFKLLPPTLKIIAVTIQNDLRVQLPTKDGTRLVNIGRNTLSINVLKPYDGWTLFRLRIERALRAYYDVAGQKTVTRVGVRYINRIVVEYPGANSADYFGFILPQESGLGAKLTNFTKRSEYVAEDQTKILITHATIAPSAPDDRICTRYRHHIGWTSFGTARGHTGRC